MSEINVSLRPNRLHEYIGQESIKARLAPYIKMARETGDPLVHIFLTSGPGEGKTSLAHCIANEVGDPFAIIDISKMTERKFISFIRKWNGGILFADEFHSATKKQQERLLTIMEEGYVMTQHGYQIPVPRTTLIAATTQAGKIDEAVMSRFDLQLRIEPYSEDEMTRIVQRMEQELRLRIGEDARALGLAAGGNPRAARDLVKAWKALGFEGGADVEGALRLTQRQRDGLSSDHMAYLKTLDRFDGQTGSVNLCSALRVSPSELKTIEKLLSDRGFIDLTPSGRVLTEVGNERLNGERVSSSRRDVA